MNLPLGRHTGQKTGRKRVDGRYTKKKGDQVTLIGAYTCHPPTVILRRKHRPLCHPLQIILTLQKERKRELYDSVILTVCFRL